MNFTDFISNNKKTIYLILWTALFLISIFLYGFGIGNEYLSGIEGFTYAMVNNPIKDVINLCHYDYNPPLYYLMIKAFSMAFGSSIMALRIFSLMGTMALIALSIGPVRRILGRKGSIVYMLLVMILPVFSYTSQNAFMFSWACFFVTGSVLYGYLVISDNRIADWIIFAVFCAASCYIHYYALVAIVFLNIFLFVYSIFKARKKIIPLAVLLAVLFFLFLPWIHVLSYQLGQIVRRYWIPRVNFLSVLNVLAYPFAGKSDDSLNLAGFALLAILLYYALRLSVIEKNKRQLLLYLAVFVYLSSIIFLYCLSKNLKSVFYPPYFHTTVGMLVIFIAYTLSRMREIKTAAIALIFLLIITLPASISIRRLRENDPIRQAYVYISLTMKDNDALLHSDDLTAAALSYYFPKNKHFLYLPFPFKGYMNYQAFGKNLTVGYDVRGFLQESKGVWILAKNENFIPYNYYKSVVYNKRYIETNEPEIFKSRNSRFTIKVVKYDKE